MQSSLEEVNSKDDFYMTLCCYMKTNMDYKTSHKGQ